MSWKHYGGLRNLDSYNNISVNNIIADKFTVRDKFLTEFQIIGETQLLGNVTLGDNSSNLIDIKSDMIAERNVDIHGDLNINGKLIITSSGEGFFLLGTDDNRLGVNIENPLAVLDIAGSYESVLNVYSDQSNNRNIIARNYLQNGIAVNTIDASSSSIQFYSGTDISNNKEAPDSEIKYLNGGILEIITGQDTRILSQVSISKDGRIGHIHNETLMVYDISNGTYKNLYYKDDTIIKGSAFSLIAYDSSANTSMNITTPDGKGAVISGGAYPKDTDRSMLILDVSNNSEEKPQALMIVSGTANETYNTTTSINKYISQIGKYSLDVNGATYISDSQIKILEEPKMELLDIRVHNNDGIALGSFSEDGKFYIYYTENGGLTWYNEEFEYDTNNNIQTGEKTKATDTFINDTVKCFVTHAPSSIPSLFYSFRTPDNPLSIWPQFQSIPLDGTENANAIYSFFNNNVNHFIVTRVTKLNIVSSNSYLFTSADLNFNIKDSKGYGNIIYVVGEAGTIKSYTVDSTLEDDNYTASVFTERTDVSYNIYPSKTYKKVFVYNANTIVAIGNGIITYTHNGGLNWYTIFISEGGTDISLNDIHIKSEKEAIVVGDNGIIYVTHDGYRTWTQLSKDYINGGGTSEYLVGNTSNNITSVTMIDDNTFITTHLISQAVFDNNGNITTPSPESKLLYTYAPSVFNRYNKSTLDVIGSLNVSGDLVLHDRGELKTTDVSFGLLRTNTRQIDFGLSGELITIGAEIGLVDLNGRLQVADDVSLNSNAFISSNLYLSGDASLNSKLFVNGDISANSNLYLGGDASLNSKLFISGDISANSNLYLGGDASLNSKLFISGDISANSNLYLSGDASLNSKLFVNGDISANSNLYLDGDASLNSKLFISGDISANSNFYLGGDASLNSKLFIGGDISANSKLNLGGDASLNSKLFIGGDISANSKLNLGGDASLKSKLFIGGDISANTNFLLGGDASLNSKLFIGGDISANTNFSLGGDASLKSKLFIGGDISANSNLKLGGDATIYSNLDVGGNALITGSLTVDGDLNFRGIVSQTDISHNVLISDQLTVRNIADNEVALVVQQDTGVSSIAEFKRGNVTKVEIKNNGDISMNSVLKIMNTTTSNNNPGGTAGALYVKGGTRLDGSLNVMGDTHFEGDITFIGSITSISEVQNAILTITSDNINNNRFTYYGIPLDTDKTSKFNINGGANFNDSISVSETIYGKNLEMTSDVSFNSNAFISSNLYLGGDASLNSKLFVNGDISANSNLYLGGDASLNSKLFINGDISANSKLNLGGDALLNSNLIISGDISANSNLYLGGDASLNSKLFISGDISANTNLYLGGDASLNSKLFVNGDISANTNLYLGGDASLNSKLFVNGDISANSNLYLGGDASLNSDLFVNGDISANTNFFLGGDASLNSKLFINGDISANTNFFLGGDASLNSKLFISGDISGNSNLYLGGDASLNSKLFISGDISANTNFYLGGDASLNSKLFVSGETILGTVNNTGVPLYVDGSGAMRIPVGASNDRPSNPEIGYIRYNTNDITFEGYGANNAWGTLGGVSNPEKTTQVYVGDNDEIVFKTNGQIRQIIDNTTGDVSMNTNLYLGGDISANSNLFLGGDASLNSKLFVNGDISANTNLYLGGDASLNSNLFVSEQTTLGTVDNSGVPLYVDGSGAMRIPVGSTENRPTTETGLIRFNTTDTTFEGYDGSNWGSLGGVSNSDKSSRIYISDASAIVFETNSIIRETIDNSGNISFNLSNNQGYGNINMNQNGTATILEIADSSNNNEIRIQNQDDIFKLIYDQSGNETSRIHMTNNEISLYPRYSANNTNHSMLLNHNGAVIGDNDILLNQLRDKDWRQIGYRSATGTQLGNTVSISRDGTRIAFGEYRVNTDASSNVHIYTVTEREMTYLQTIPINGGNVSSIDLNEDGTIIVIGKHNTVPNGQIELWKYDGIDYVQVGVLQNGTTVTAQFGHTTSINNDGTIFAAGQYTNNAGKPGIEGGVLIFNYIGDSITKIADISLNNTGTDDQYLQMGRSIELNGAGDRIVIGGTIDNTIDAVYRLYVYQKQVNGAWNQVLDITNPTSVGINFGISVAMSNDGKVISVATQEDLLTVEPYGQVLVYDLFGTGLSGNLTSSLRGSAIKLMNINDGDIFGASMSLNDDGTVLAIGTGSHTNFNGQASIYKYLNSDWTIVKTIPGTSKSNLGGIHDHDIESGQLISDEDGICVDGTGELVIIGAPNLFTADGIEDSGNGQVYLYRNQTYTLGVNKKLRVKGDVVVENGTLDVSGNIIVSGSGINKIISDNYGIGNHIQSTNAGGRNVFEGGSNYIYSQDMGNGDTGGHNRLYATQANGYNYINATGSGGTNYIEANISGSNRLKVNGVDKIITNASTTTLTNGTNTLTATTLQNKLTSSVTTGVVNYITATGGGDNKLQATTGQNMLTSARATGVANYIEATGGGDNKIQSTGNNTMISSITSGIANRIEASSGGYNYMTANTNQIYSTSSSGYNRIQAVNYNSIQGKNTYIDISNNNGGSLFVRNWTNNTDQINNESRIIMSAYTNNGASMTTLGQITCQPEYNVPGNPHGTMNFDVWSYDSGWALKTQMRILSGGNVGIGTTNPNFKTQITYAGADAINYGLNIQNSTATGASNRMNLVLFTDGNSTQGAMGGYRVSHTSHYLGGLVFYIGSQPSGYTLGTATTPTQATNSLTEAMRIAHSGNVGIGTTDPGAKLEITTPQVSTQIETLLKLSHGTYRPKFNFQSVDNGYGWSFNTGFIGHGMSLSPVAGQKITCQSDTTSIYSSGIAFSGGAGLRFYTNQVGGGTNTDYTATTIERMRIADNGNVGIGTTDPGSKLHVYDNINVSSSFISTPNGFNYNSLNASVKLHAFDSFYDNNESAPTINAIRISSYGTNDLPTAPTVNNPRGAGWKSELFIGTMADENAASSSSRGFLSYNQNFSIVQHISSDTETLSGISANIANHILPNIGATDATTVAILTCNPDGNVGIGTTDPGAKLHVDGEIRVKENCIRLQNNSSNFAVGARVPITTSSATNIETNEINGSKGSENYYTTYDAGFLRLSAGGGTSTTNKSYIDLYGYNSNIITFGTTGAERMVVDSAGNVGIGTTNPGSKLDVVGAVKATSYNLDTDSNENKIRLYGNGEAYTIGLATGNAFGGLTQAQWSMTFKVSSADNDNRGFLWKRSDHTASQGAMSLTAKGNLNVASNTRIGYGTSSTTLPSGAMLDVNGSVKATSFSGDGSALTGIVSATAAALTSGNKTITGTLNISGNVTTGNTLYIGTNDNSTTSKTIYFGGTFGDNIYENCVIENRIYETGTEKRELLLFSGNDIEGSSGPDRIRLKGGNIRFDTYNAATDVRTTETTKMIIDQDGNVGIGTTNPGAKLHIATNSVNIFTPNDNIGIHDEATALLITSDGDLQDVNNISFAMKMVSDTNSLISPNGKLNFYANAGSANNNSGLTPNNLIMSLVGNGNVGIGTTNPGAKLEVSGGGILVRRILNSSNQIGEILTMQVIQDTISIRKYSIKHLSDAQGNFRMGIFSQNYSTDVDTERFTLKGGNVGIGTTDPGSKLDVNGTVSATSFNATSDIRVKTNIQTIVLKTALDQINQLEPKSYQFYDNDTTHYGLIAQEAEQIIPEAVISDGSRMIPSIGEICKLINGGKTIVLDAKTTKDMVATKLEFDDISGNKQSVGIESLEGDKYIHLKESIEPHLNNGDTVFVHGHEVQDFRSINYNTILAVSIAATKELSKELGQTRAELGQTRAELGQTRAELGQTRAELNALKELVNQLINK